MSASIIIEREAFRSGWKTVARGGSKINATYNSVLVESGADEVRLTSFDYATAIRKVIPARCEKGSPFMVPQEEMKGLVPTLPDGPLSLTPQDGVTVLKAGSGEYRLPAPNANDFAAPILTEDEATVTVPAAELIAVIEAVRYAASADQARAALCGILLRWGPETGLVAAATDGHRLAEASRPLAVPAENAALVPATALDNLAKDLAASPTAPVRLACDLNTFQASYGETMMTTRLIGAEYPNYRRVIPAGAPATRIVVDREEFLATVKRLGSLLSGDAPRLILTATGLLLEAQVSQVGGAQAREEIVPVEMEGDPGETIVNHKYMVQALTALASAQAEIGLYGKIAPVVVRPVGEPGALHLMAAMADTRP